MPQRHLWSGLKLAARIAILALLVAWAVRQIHWRDYVVVDGRPVAVADASGTAEPVHQGLFSAVRDVHPLYIVAPVLCIMASTLIALFRWRLILRVQNIRLRAAETVRISYLVAFFTEVLPGPVGGDAVRTLIVARSSGRPSAVIVSIILDRLIGACGFILLACIALVIALAAAIVPREYLVLPALSLAVILGGVCVTGIVLLSQWIRTWLKLWRLFPYLPFGKYLMGSGHAAALYLGKWPLFVRAGVQSLVGQSLSILAVAIIAAGMHIPAPWYMFLLAVPLVGLLRVIPLTPGGIGVAETLYIFFLSSAGTPTTILAMALLVRLSSIIAALPGAVLAIGGGRLPSVGVIRKELDKVSSEAD